MLYRIEEYYKAAGVNPLLIKRKLIKLERHADIAEEFLFWIEHKAFKTEMCTEVNGYTAKDIANLSPFMNGEGAFLLLIELREDPRRATQRIKEGFTLK